MAAITASMVGALRAKTDAPMMECKKALTEADGDMDKAEELLRVKLGSKAGKAASRIAAEGVVAATVEGTTGALIEVNCETDFVTKNDSFLAFAKSLVGAGRREEPGRRRRAVGAAAQPGRLRADGRGRSQGPDRQDRREHVDPPLPALRRRRQARQLPARHAHRRAGRVRGRRDRGQGRRDARRGDEAEGADDGRRRPVADRRRALGRDAARRRGRREGQGRGQGRCSRPRSSPSGSKARSPSS